MRQGKSLLLKCFIVFAVFVVLGIFLLGSILALTTAEQIRRDKYELLTQNCEQVLSVTLHNYLDNGYQYVDKDVLFSTFKVIGMTISADIFLTDRAGNTLLCSHEEENCEHKVISPEVMYKVFAGTYQEIGTLGGIYNKHNWSVGKPIVMPDGSVRGAVFVSADAQSNVTFTYNMIRTTVISLLVFTVVMLIVMYQVIRRMLSPVGDFVSAADSFTKGEYTARISADYKDVEYAKLKTAFNNMAESVSVMEKSNRSFVANVSHELKTPMTIIAGFVDGMLDGTIPKEQQTNYLRKVSDEIKRLSRLVVSMLNLVKIEAGESSLKKMRFDIKTTILSILFSFENRIEAKNVDIRGLDDNAMFVFADPDMIHQVIFNLVENAVKFVNESGYIAISCKEENGMLSVAIRNSGEGIAESELHHVFERFYKTDGSRSIDKSSMGLGLHIVRSIVRMHGGDINLVSVLKKYTEFTFTLPIK